MYPELSDGDMEDKQRGSKSPHQLEMDEQNKVNHEHDKKDGSHIECKYMRAAHGFLSNTTFHGITWVLEDFSSYVKFFIVFYFIFMFISAFYSVIVVVVEFYPVRPQKVSVSTVSETELEFPKLTLCSPAYFSKQRLAQYDLDDPDDAVANYLILSLQVDQMSPALSKTQADYDLMEQRIDTALVKHNMTYLEMLRKVAITCDEFILFVRERKYDPKTDTWPKKCGEVFSEIPILTGFGTCFITNPNYKISTSQAGFTERMTILLSTHIEIDKDAAWLNDEALRSGVFFSLPARDHHVNALAVNSQILSPGTTNLIAMTRKKTDRSGFSEDDNSYLAKNQVCRSRDDVADKLESSLPFTDYNHALCRRKYAIRQYEDLNQCSLLSLYGTRDLVSDMDVCRRAVMQNTMPILRRTPVDKESVEMIEALCPISCIEETIDTHLSFNLVSEESHNRAWKLWQLPANRTKDDAVFMELFYKTMDVEVTKFDPFTFSDLLSSIGGTLGLFLGGSIFSLFEFMLVFGFFLVSMLNLAVQKIK